MNEKGTVVLIHGAWLTPAGWEEVADFAIDWASRNARRQDSSQTAAA